MRDNALVTPEETADEGMPVSAVQQWEYKVMYWNSWDWPLLEQTLNDLGRAGWEVTATLGETLLLKRPVPERSADA